MLSTIEMISSLLVPIVLLYLTLIVAIFGQRYLKIAARDKRLKFTQEEVKEKRKEVSEILNKITEAESVLLRIDDPSHPFNQYVISVFSIYNELVVGIYEGIFDEHYVKMALGYEMFHFYKKYAHTTFNNKMYQERFMVLELMLKKWDKDGFSIDANMHRGAR